MKTTIKAVCAAALILMLAACNAGLAPTKPADDSFAFNADQYFTAGSSEVFTISFSPDFTKYGDEDKHQVTFTFSHDVTPEGIKDGIAFYKLEDAAEAWQMPKKTPIPVNTVQTSGKLAYVTLNTKNVKHLYVYITADKVHAVNKAKLNKDKDNLWGEPFDDDYAFYKKLDDMAPALKGNYDFDLETGSLFTNTTFLISAGSDFSFVNGEKAEAGFVKKIKISDTALSLKLFSPTYTDAEKKAILGSYAAVLDKHIKAEQFNWKDNKWESITVAPFTHNESKNAWLADIGGVSENRRLRIKWVDIDKMQLVLKTYKYPLKATLKNNDPKEKDVQTGTSSGNLPGFTHDADFWPANLVSMNKTAGQVTLTLELPAQFGSVLYEDDSWHNVKTANKDSTKKTLFKGFAKDTVKKEHFKVRGSSNKSIGIKSIDLVQNDVAQKPHAWDKIIISFEDPTVLASRVFISPDVTSEAFEGYYEKGSEKKDVLIPALRLADNKPSDHPEQWGGWLERF